MSTNKTEWIKVFSLKYQTKDFTGETNYLIISMDSVDFNVIVFLFSFFINLLVTSLENFCEKRNSIFCAMAKRVQRIGLNLLLFCCVLGLPDWWFIISWVATNDNKTLIRTCLISQGRRRTKCIHPISPKALEEVEFDPKSLQRALLRSDTTKVTQRYKQWCELRKSMLFRVQVKVVQE